MRAPLPLRLIIGYGFMAHGWAKLSRGPEGFAKLLAHIGAPFPEATAWVSTLVEILGGLAIFAGAFVAVVSVPLIVMMFVAMFTVHLRYGFSAINTIGLTADGPQFGPPGIEVNLLYIAGLLAADPGRAQALCRSTDCSQEESESRRPHHPDRLHPALSARSGPPHFQELPVARWRPGSVHTLPHFVRISNGCHPQPINAHLRDHHPTGVVEQKGASTVGCGPSRPVPLGEH